MIGALGAGDPRAVGRYRMLAELGRGGMGRVLLGAGPDGRLVAVKLVRAQLVEDEDFRSRFRREVSASRKVSGAYTAAVVDSDADAPVPWLASVFVPGPPLSDVVAKAGPLPADSVLRLAAGLAAALVEVHGAGLVHRDLKPSNVLVSADGPRVIDFGIARAADSEGGSEITHTGWLIGSPGFMSPEQAEGRALTAASDVFSLGCVLFFACTGKGPFVGPSTPQTLYNVVHADPELGAVPVEVRGIVERCLAKASGDRPTPAGLLEELAGRVTPAAQSWPRAVHDLIARQQAEVAALLGPPVADETVVGDGDATRRVFAPWTRLYGASGLFGQAGQGGAAGQPGVVRSRGGGVALAGTVVAVFVVLASLVVWALWPAAEAESGSAGESPTTTSEEVPAYEYGPPSTTEETTTEAEVADDAYAAGVGDCLADSSGAGSEDDLYLDSCVAGNYEVLDRVEGAGSCDAVNATWTVTWAASETRDGLVLCLEYLYDNPVYNAAPGECVWAESPDGGAWEVVPCGDYVFEIMTVFHGSADHARCGDDVRLRFSLAREEERADLSAVACMTFRYGNDGAFARTDNCLMLVGTGAESDPTFTDCANATHYVSGYDSDTYDPDFCGSDGWHGWDDNGLWGDYLDYTICLRQL